WDPQRQRAVVTIWVKGDADVVQTVTTAIAAVADPNRPFRVVEAVPSRIRLSFTAVRDRRYADEAVQAALVEALLDDGTGLFGRARRGIGEAVSRSQISRAGLDVPGVLAVEGLALGPALQNFMPLTGGPPVTRWSPGAGWFFSLEPAHLFIATTEAADA